MQKILIVEDDIDIQDILKNHLIDVGYEVAVASDGVAGIAMFDDTIDLVLLDIMLPKIDGYDVDAIRAARHDADDGAVQRLGLPVKLVTLQRCNDVNGCSCQPHTPGDKLHSECFACAGGAENRHIRIFIDAGTEVVQADKGVIVLVHAQQYAVGIAQLKADERIKAGCGGGKNIAAVFLEQRRIRGAKRQGREKGCLLPETAQLQIHILRDHELAYLPDAPL